MLMLMLSRSAISLLRSPCATNRSTSISRCESWFELSAVDEDCRTKLAMRSIMASSEARRFSVATPWSVGVSPSVMSRIRLRRGTKKAVLVAKLLQSVMIRLHDCSAAFSAGGVRAA